MEVGQAVSPAMVSIFAIGRRNRLPHQKRRALQATSVAIPSCRLSAGSRLVSSFQESLSSSGECPSADISFEFPPRCEAWEVGQAVSPAMVSIFALGRRNRLPHQERRALQATFSRSPNLPAFIRQSFSMAQMKVR
jgi:hypothetical protein